jgi:hypothetical protein
LLEWLGSDKQRRAIFRALCDCGNEVQTNSQNLGPSDNPSCGCAGKERVRVAVTKHGRSRRFAPDPAYLRAVAARRRLPDRRAIPTWADQTDIFMWYEVAEVLSRGGVKFEVDHLVPMHSSLVCGLHTADNMTVVPSRFNSSKGNRWWPDMPDQPEKRDRSTWHQHRAALLRDMRARPQA